MRVSVSGLLTPLVFLMTWVPACDALGEATSAGDSPQSSATVSRRPRVEVSLQGELSQTERATLLNLLETELSSSGLQLTTKDAAAAEATSTDVNAGEVLMRVALDVRSDQTWTITIVDVARSKTLRREQAGPRRDGAALEATVSILAAAASALREGFELSSNPPSLAVAPAPRTSPSEKVAQRRVPALLVTSSLGASVATFTRQVLVQAGPAASFGVRFRNASTLQLRAAHYFADSFASRFGTFQLDRTQFALAGGFAWTTPTLEAELSLGLSTELLRRRAERSAPGVAFGADANTIRIGGELVGQLRYRIFEFLAVQAALGAAYFPKPIRFVAAVADNRVLTEPFKLVGIGCLGLELRAP